MVTLEKLTTAHQVELAELANDPLISVSSSVDHPCTVETVQNWMDEENRLTFVVFRDKDMVGAISLKRIDYEERTAEASYWIAQKFWGQGLAKAALDAAINFAFKELDFLSVQAFCLRDGNPSSLKVLQSRGFELNTERAGHPTVKRWGEAFPGDEWRWHLLTREKWKKLSSRE